MMGARAKALDYPGSPGHGVSIHAGQLDIQKDQVGLPSGGHGDSGLPVAGSHDPISIGLQQEGGEVTVLSVVLNQKSRSARFAGGLMVVYVGSEITWRRSLSKTSAA